MPRSIAGPLALIACSTLTLATVARAQDGTQTVLNSEGRCVQSPACSTIGTSCGTGGTAGTCARAGDGTAFCVPTVTTACCLVEGDCPTIGGVSYSCLSVAGVVFDETGIDARICVEAGRAYCDGDSTEEIALCHTTLDASAGRVRWVNGDCDRDGTRNSLDPEPCMPALDRGIYVDGDCESVRVGCVPGATCDVSASGTEGTCMNSEDGRGTACAPDGGPTSVLYCADPFACRPGGETVVSTSDGAFCVPVHCSGSVADLSACIFDGDEPVPFEDGDCDSDGASNKDETEAGTDLCVDESMVDAGAPPVDAGAPPVDAGDLPAPDAGSQEPDAGTAPEPDAGGVAFDAALPETDAGAEPIDPRFEGGGGCGCRAPAGDAGHPLAPLALLALALVRVRRR